MLKLVMRGAFVVQLRKAAPGGTFEGLVEEVDTGKQARFRSQKELIAFLEERFALAQAEQPVKGKTE